MHNNSKRKGRSSQASNQHQRDDDFCSFNENDRKQLQKIHDVKILKDEIVSLKDELEISNSKLAAVKSENAQLKQAFTLTNFKLDTPLNNMAGGKI